MVQTGIKGQSGLIYTNLSYLTTAVRARAAGHEVELDIGEVQAAVGELGRHPRQSLEVGVGKY